jgi:F0F1-type ATP synthase epsilon subunit
MIFKILSPQEKKIFSVAWIEINTAQGNFVIQKGHAPAIFVLAANQPITVRLNTGKEETFLVSEGILEITRTSALLLLNK